MLMTSLPIFHDTSGLLARSQNLTPATKSLNVKFRVVVRGSLDATTSTSTVTTDTNVIVVALIAELE
jgi:hypothetical protein